MTPTLLTYVETAETLRTSVSTARWVVNTDVTDLALIFDKENEMKDKNGMEIQSGDLLRIPEQFGESLFTVIQYANGELGLQGQEVHLSELVSDFEVVTPEGGASELKR